MADIEIAKLITAYGGVTEHDIDVAHLAPLFDGEWTFTGFVDTWVTPGWRMDFSLLFEPVSGDGLQFSNGAGLATAAVNRRLLAKAVIAAKLVFIRYSFACREKAWCPRPRAEMRLHR